MDVDHQRLFDVIDKLRDQVSELCERITRLEENHKKAVTRRTWTLSLILGVVVVAEFIVLLLK